MINTGGYVVGVAFVAFLLLIAFGILWLVLNDMEGKK